MSAMPAELTTQSAEVDTDEVEVDLDEQPSSDGRVHSSRLH